MIVPKDPSRSRNPEERNHTFFFADLAGYTALTEAHGDEQAADLVGDFCAEVRKLLPTYGAEDVKTIGDALMVRCDDAGGAVRLALDVVHLIGSRHGFPSVRVGIHTGPAVGRGGDWFGAAVNVAARVSSVARGGEVLVTEATRREAGALEQVELRERGRERLKNVAEAVSLYAAVRTGAETAEGLPLDPVCRMAVDPEQSAGRLRHGGTEHCFCSMACAQAFAEAPERYVTEASATAHSGPSLDGVVAAVQGSSYMGFGLWALAARADYRRRHRIESESWLLNAHSMSLLLVGATLARAGYRGELDRRTRTLGMGAAVGLAINDVASAATEGVSPIYYADAIWEGGLAAWWIAASLRKRGAS